MNHDDNQMLPLALDADRREHVGRSGRLSYYVAGEGPPLLLLHSINATSSAYEVRPIFEHYRKTRRVFAPDLPGFGFADRSQRDYSVRLYTDAVHDMLDQIGGDSPVDVLALSLTSEFAARAAVERPDRTARLMFVTPTGFNRGAHKMRAPAGETREVRWLYQFVSVPLWRKRLFRLLVKPGVIRYFLKRTYGSDDIDDGLAQYAGHTAQQPDAEHAPLAFLSARLFSKDIRTVYESLSGQVWLQHATKGDFKDFREADWARKAANWTVQPIEGGALPHFEVPEAFFPALDAFLDQPM